MGSRFICAQTWPTAISTHTANHPSAEHIRAVPSGRLNLLVASPECTHHSRARGGKPIKDQSRASAWHVARWAGAFPGGAGMTKVFQNPMSAQMSARAPNGATENQSLGPDMSASTANYLIRKDFRFYRGPIFSRPYLSLDLRTFRRLPPPRAAYCHLPCPQVRRDAETQRKPQRQQMKRTAPALLAICTALHGQMGKPLPRFEDYPVTEEWRGPNAPVKLVTKADRMYRRCAHEGGIIERWRIRSRFLPASPRQTPLTRAPMRRCRLRVASTF